MKLNSLERFFRAALLGLIVIFWYHQIIKGPYYKGLSNKNRIKIIPLMPERGDLSDREGEKIATKRASFDVTVIPQELRDEEFVFKELSRILDIPLDELKKRYRNNFMAPFFPVTLVKDISLEKVFALEEKKPNFEGVEIQTNSLRVYPFGTTAAHLLGYLSEINVQELRRLKPYGYGLRSLVGKSGLEKNLDLYLRGNAGGRQIEVDNRGNPIRILGEKEAVPGKVIELTIDIKWQEIAHRLLKGHKGAILIMDIRDGKILVMESSPSFDPNLFVSGNERRLRALLSSRNSPLLNRALKANFAPGSVFKLVTATAGLETKKINLYSRYRCEGKFYLGEKAFFCWRRKGHGEQNIVQAIAHSCNVFFYNLGLALGPEKINRFAKVFALGEKTGIELKEEGKGLIPGPGWKYSHYKERWYKGDTLNFAIGQGYTLISPIQILRLVAGIGNGGFLLRPYLIRSIGGVPVQEARKEYTGISKVTLDIIRKGMFRVVNDTDGTGNRAKVEGLEIAAKTATAQTSKNTTHAWITGFLPYTSPKLSFVIFLEYGGRGGVEAADICHSLFSQLKKELLNYR